MAISDPDETRRNAVAAAHGVKTAYADAAGLIGDTTQAVVRAFSYFLHLLNVAEDSIASRVMPFSAP